MRQIRIGSAFAGAAALALALVACTTTTTVVKYGGSPGATAGASAAAKASPSPTGPAVTITPGGGDKTADPSTGISVAAAAHLATVTPHMPFFEFLPPELCESRLRKELVVDEVQLIGDGKVSIPERPGLGVELDREALEMFKEAARKVRP